MSSAISSEINFRTRDRKKRQNVKTSGQPTHQKMFALLLILSVSYWYCLPMMTQSLLDYSEFRGYDLLLLILVAVVLIRYLPEVRAFLQKDGPGYYLFRFTAWATATYPVTIAVALFNSRPSWI